MKNLVIVSPGLPSYSETFIQAHIDLLPVKVHHLYGIPKRGYPPLYTPSGAPLFSDNIVFNYLEAGIDRLANESGIGYTFRTNGIVNYLKKNQIDAVLAEYGPVGTFLMDACEKADIPLIVHYHGRDAYHYKTLERFKSRYQRMFQLAKAIVVVSTDMKAQLLQIGAPENKIFLNPYGPNQSHFTFKEGLEKPPHFLSVGRFTGKKAPDLLIKAFSIAAKEVPEARLFMVADGPLFEASQSLAQSLGLADKINFLGPKTPKEIGQLHQKCRVFVQHSVRAEDGDSEGTPVAILEAMSSGMPIISTRHAGIKDAVIENENGYLVDERDYESMAQHMIRLAKDAQLAQALGKKAAERIEENYTIQKHIDTLHSIISETVPTSV